MARISAAALFAAVLLACAVFAATAEEPAAVNRGHVTVPKHWLKSGIRVRNQDTGVSAQRVKRPYEQYKSLYSSSISD